MQRTRPVILTALAAILAFFLWRILCSGGRWPIRRSANDPVMILLFLPTLYAVWFRITPPKVDGKAQAIERQAQPMALAAE